MLQGLNNGWDLIKESIRVFYRHPQFLIPLLLTWSIYAPTVLYLKYRYNWDAYTWTQNTLLVFFVVFVFAFLLASSCSVLLELIQDIESGEKPHIRKAFIVTFTRNIFRILPIVLIWTIVWFFLLLIQALLSKDKSKENDSFTAENAAKTLAGFQSFSFSKAFFKSLEKGIRMVVFLILPAIAWEDMSFVQAIKRGFSIFKSNLTVFVSGFLITGLASALIFFPPVILFVLSQQMDLLVPDWVWLTTIIYIAFAWSYSIYLEQMFVAHLYLWHLKWEKAVLNADKTGKAPPLLADIPKPSILDEVGELLFKH